MLQVYIESIASNRGIWWCTSPLVGLSTCQSGVQAVLPGLWCPPGRLEQAEVGPQLGSSSGSGRWSWILGRRASPGGGVCPRLRLSRGLETEEADLYRPRGASCCSSPGRRSLSVSSGSQRVCIPSPRVPFLLSQRPFIRET